MEEEAAVTNFSPAAAFSDEQPPSAEQAMLAKSRADRAWNEFKSILYTQMELENSLFAGPGHAELQRTLGNFRLFRSVKQSSSVLSTLLKLNLMLSAIVVFFFTFQIASTGDKLFETFLDMVTVGRFLPAVILATVALAFLAGLLWLSQRPKRLKVFPHMLVLRTDLNETFFSELIIPWQTVERVRLIHRKLVGSSELETNVEIGTALGVKHHIPIDDLLIDNSEAAFINAVRTWAPWAAKELTFERGAGQVERDKGARLTELWLHQFSTSDVRKESGMLVAGTTLAGARSYTVLGVLGGGGQGNTYLAAVTEPTSADEEREVVLKEYIMPIYRGSEVLASLTKKLAEEANLLARLDHPSVVKVSDHFVADYRGYLVLEYVEGRSLKQLVADEGPQPESFVMDVAGRLLDVLKYMHSFEPPIVHRDLSPDNIMLSNLGEIKVVDFNVARQLEGSAGGTVVGKHAYIPPEQFRGKPAPASDIYALGGTLHFLLTGQDPEPLTVSRPRAVNKNISVAVDDFIARATALELTGRYASAEEMAAGLPRGA
ncbi:MAG: serine/threonine protein kinase [Cyanobacteria bacterium SZAS LIN-2]|nr:serine/threonine protein kinase [Cyanobacteria bacterium SZAS LIN-2]MBS2007683.1 serine/threonine protein kinase [Cyanobacteria bacterium SZAS TMP-1]